jgi:hypothetical protein
MANVTGQSTLNQLSLIEVDADPAAAAGTPAPIGSIAFFNSGTIGSTYIKVGAADTAWNISTIQASALTSGSIAFTNSSGYLAQNNASLFWDQTNNRIGIGTNTPLRPLSVAASTASGDSGAFIDGYGANATALTLRRANGTLGSPTAVTSGQVMAEFDTIGYGTSQFAANQTGSIAFIAAETFTNTANGTHIAFYTAPIGSITEAERLRIHASGRILIGTTTDDGATQLQVTGRIAATDAIRPGGSTDATEGNIRFNLVNLELFQQNEWRKLHTTNRSITTGLQSTTSNAHSNITELVSVSLGIGIYRVWVLGKFQSTATGTGIGFRLVGGTATILAYFLDWQIEQAANGTDQDFKYKQITGTVNVTSASVIAANTDYIFRCDGVIEISSAGTVQMQFRSETNGTGVSVRAGSVLVLEKI